MTVYLLIAVIVSLVAFFACVNHRFFHLPLVIAVMLAAMGLSLLGLLLSNWGWRALAQDLGTLVAQIPFQDVLLKGMLSFLLFAGAFTVEWRWLKRYRWEIGVLASVGTVLSTGLVGVLVHFGASVLGLSLGWMPSLLFGALISPTDPIAVLATFKSLNAPKAIEVCVAGESLFNDGVGIVLFTTLYAMAFGHHLPTAGHVLGLFLQQAMGGLAYGAVLAWVLDFALRTVKEFKLSILLTLAAVTGGYQLAFGLQVSGALAMVVLGLFLGHQARLGRYGKEAELGLAAFWEVVDEVLNAILFFLMGLELVLLLNGYAQWLLALACIPGVLLVRLITVAVPMRYFALRKGRMPYAVTLLTWGGLRGGLAIALALSLPNVPERQIVLAMTYLVVAFSVIVQGFSIRPWVSAMHRALNAGRG